MGAFYPCPPVLAAGIARTEGNAGAGAVPDARTPKRRNARKGCAALDFCSHATMALWLPGASACTRPSGFRPSPGYRRGMPSQGRQQLQPGAAQEIQKDCVTLVM